MKNFLYITCLVFCLNTVSAQTPWYLTGNTPSGTNFLGSTNAQDVRLKTEQSQAIRFYTTAGAGTFNNERMTILNGGNVGIGIANPAQRLSVSGGSIQLVTTTAAYMIGTQRVLRHNGIATNIYVGVGAGAVDVGSNNTFVGYNTGFANTSGTENTFIGHIAGSNNTTGMDNLFLGHQSGNSNTTGSFNIALGFNSGSVNTTGSSNIFMGRSANAIAANLTNANAIGAFARVDASNSMVLGSINGINGATANTSVGIGTTTPSASLHIDGTFRYRVNGANPTNGHVLTTDSNGNATWQALPNGIVSGCTTSTTNFITKWCGTANQIQNSIVFENVSIPANPTIGIGTTNPTAKLDVRNSLSANVFNFGMNSLVTSSTNQVNIGTFSAAQNAQTANVGVVGHSPSFISFSGLAPYVTTGSINPPLPVNAIPMNAGVIGRASGAKFNFGGVFEANECPSANSNFGIYASARKECVLGSFSFAAGYFNGPTIAIQGYQPSDIQFKDSLIEFRGALGILADLKPQRFVYKNSTFPSLEFPRGQQIGLMAQELDTVLPNLVANFIHPPLYDTAGTLIADSIHFKAVNYTGLIPIAIAGIQEQQAQLDSLFTYYVKSESLATDSNYLTKWSATNRSLTNSLLYDDGQHVGIPTTDPEAKFYVESDSLFAGSFSSTNGIGGKFYGGIHGLTSLSEGSEAEQSGLISGARGGTSRNKGVVGSAFYYTTDSVINIGVSGIADSSDYVNTGVFGLVNAATENAVNVGVTGIGNGSQNQNMGGYFQTDGINSSDIALFATNLGGNMAGYFDGDVHVTGSITSSSDAALKQNIQSLPTSDAVAKLALLQPKSYEFVDSGTVDINLPRGIQYGFLAQEVEQVLPGLVKEVVQPQRLDSQGHIVSEALEYKGINYTGLIPLLVSAVQEQQTKIDSLQQVIDNRLLALEQRLNNCCARGAVPSDASFKTEGNATVVELNNLQAVVLEQNAPNPFAEQTTINYYIPEGSGAAQVVFFDMLGRTIKSVDAKSGYGSLTVFASNLSQGQYSYALFINGQQIASKSMIKAK